MRAYIRSISRKAWFLIWVSIGYLLMVALLSQFLTFDNALFAAQVIYVGVLLLPLMFPSIGRQVGLYEQRCKTPKEKVERELLFVEAAISSIRRFIDDRRARPVVPKAEPADQAGADPVSGKRDNL